MKTAAIALLLASAVVASASEDIAEPIKRFLARHPSLDQFIGKTADKKKDEGYQLRQGMKDDYVFHRFSYPPRADDAFIYEICFNTKTSEFWIVRSGGFAGVFELFGPYKSE